MNRLQLLFLSVLTGLLLTLGWPANGFPFLLFFAFIPLLFVENHFAEGERRSGLKIAPYALLSFFLWNLLTTYWIKNSTYIGAALAIVFNATFMTAIFTIFHITHKKIHTKGGEFIALIFYWVSFEHLHHNWALNWPWLNLGNGFSNYTKFVQWYEYTGILGGSIWILAVNILFFLAIKYWIKGSKHHKTSYIYGGIAALLLFIPIIISVVIYHNYTEKINPVDITVVQPNVDPYAEQYTLPPVKIVDKILLECKGNVDSKTDLIVTPESAIQEYAFENEINDKESIILLRQNLKKYPKAKMVVGMSTARSYMSGDMIPPTARQSDFGYYDAYNTAILFDTTRYLQLRHKSRLTPGVEIMPFYKYLKFLNKYAINLGGTIGTLATDSIQLPFTVNDKLKVATIICYESAYGDFVNEFVRNGANIILVITNDGWWGHTPGYKQHFLFSRLRAIETRRSVARSANTGTSGFINQRGDVIKQSDYWVGTSLRQKLNANDQLTFYVKHGDYLARFSVYGTILFLLLTLVLTFIKRRK
jgi:apolipoprotein N-acyltransferase